MSGSADFKTTRGHLLALPRRIFRAISLAWKTTPGWTIASAALTFVQGLLPLASLYLIKLIVDAVTAAIRSGGAGDDFGRVLFLIALAGAVAVLTVVLQSAGGLVSENQGHVITDHVQDLLHAKSVEADLAYYENPEYFDTLHRAQREAPYRPMHILDGILRLGQSGLSLGALVALLLSLHWGVAAVLFAASVPTILLRVRYSKRLYRWEYNRTATERRSNYFSTMLTSDMFAKEIRLFELGPLFRETFRSLRDVLRRERLGMAAKKSAAEVVGQGVATAGVFGAYAFIAQFAIEGKITLGDMVMYFQALQRGWGYLRDILVSLASLYEDGLFLANFFDFLDIRPMVAEPPIPKGVPKPIREGIAFENVSFRYPESREDALRDISLRVHPDETIALVGENGSGKTTLVKLLCRLYDPTRGRILVDGNDLRDFRTADIRREFSVVFQDFVKYNLTVRENIAFGNVDLARDESGDARVVEAARRAGIHDQILKLQHGYDTILGKWFEDGEELSIGQWQKIALARAFLRDSQIIVLDEPTSAMDAKAEFEVFNGFNSLSGGKMAVLISHRFSTVRMADRIFVVDQGRITESGNHSELMKLGGQYAILFDLQARSYR
jgi:ATP-binding cassette subfamily B protein